MDQQQPATGTSLVRKLSDVMGQIGRIPKNGTNTFHGYQYVMESDLVEAVRDRLAEKHVFISSSVKGVEVIELTKLTKQGTILPVKVGVLHLEYTIRDGESGETITSTVTDSCIPTAQPESKRDRRGGKFPVALCQ